MSTKQKQSKWRYIHCQCYLAELQTHSFSSFSLEAENMEQKIENKSDVFLSNDMYTHSHAKIHNYVLWNRTTVFDTTYYWQLKHAPNSSPVSPTPLPTHMHTHCLLPIVVHLDVKASSFITGSCTWYCYFILQQHTHIHTNTHTLTCVCTHTHTHTHTNLHTQTHTHTPSFSLTHTHMQTHTYTHTHTNT